MRLLIGPSEVDAFLEKYPAIRRDVWKFCVGRFALIDLLLILGDVSYFFPIANRHGHLSRYEKREMYSEYLYSPEWEARRRHIIAQRGPFCEYCEMGDTTLQLHHLTYDRLYEELDEDLKLLCVDCHEVADERRKYEKALRTWVLKVRDIPFDTMSEDRQLYWREEFDYWYEERGGVIPVF